LFIVSINGKSQRGCHKEKSVVQIHWFKSCTHPIKRTQREVFVYRLEKDERNIKKSFRALVKFKLYHVQFGITWMLDSRFHVFRSKTRKISAEFLAVLQQPTSTLLVSRRADRALMV
jgi:hypothetical protein